MAQIIDRRVTADFDGDFVLFLIGMRVNRPLKVHKWAPVFTAMPRMIKELEQNPAAGMLGARLCFAGPLSPLVVQYWRSFEQLEAYARSKDAKHWPAWVGFNKRIGSSGDVGIWHETYLVADGQHESVYNNMPPTGLGAVGELVKASGRRSTASGRAKGSGAEYPEGAREGADL